MYDTKASALIMAGGTGGHIFPGIAVAQELINRDWQVSWLGSKGGMEETIVAKAAIELNLISVAGLRGNGLIGWLKSPFSLTHAVFQSVKIIKKLSPKVVIGFGGFASGPGGLAAIITGTPLVIHEQNAVAGLTNRVLKKVAKMTFQAFPNAFAQSGDSDKKLKTVGNPIRAEILKLNKKAIRKKSKKDKVNVLVVGGSRGALALNKHLPVALCDLIKQQKVKVLHQAGKNHLCETKKFYAAKQLSVVGQDECLEIVEFIEDMASAFSWADLVICRAGASTVSEVAAAGVCAIFVPFPYAVDDHQTANANWLVNQQAALSYSEEKMLDKNFTDILKNLISDPLAINTMAKNAKKAAYLNAAEEVANYCETLRNKAA